MTKTEALAIAESELSAEIDAAILKAEHIVLQAVRDGLPLTEATAIIESAHLEARTARAELLARLRAAGDKLNLSGVGPVW